MAIQLALFGIFGLAGVLLVPGLSLLGRVALILSMLQTGAGFGALLAAVWRRDGLGYLPALGSVITGALLGVISATQF